MPPFYKIFNANHHPTGYPNERLHGVAQTDTPALRQMFGDSQAVDKDGRFLTTHPYSLPRSSGDADFPQITTASVPFYHIVGVHGEYALYEHQNQRMGGKYLRMLHTPTGWLKDAPDRTKASKMASRHADGLVGIPPDYGGNDGWGNTKTFNWNRPTLIKSVIG